MQTLISEKWCSCHDRVELLNDVPYIRKRLIQNPYYTMYIIFNYVIKTSCFISVSAPNQATPSKSSSMIAYVPIRVYFPLSLWLKVCIIGGKRNGEVSYFLSFIRAHRIFIIFLCAVNTTCVVFHSTYRFDCYKKEE